MNYIKLLNYRFTYQYKTIEMTNIDMHANLQIFSLGNVYFIAFVFARYYFVLSVMQLVLVAICN